MHGKKIVFGCVTDQKPRFLEQAVRLVASLRWFGGEVAESLFVVAAVDGMPAPYETKLKRLGADIRAVKRFDERHGPSNKLRFLEFFDLESFDTVALLDCDTIMVQDPLAFLPESGFAAKPADLPTVTTQQFNRIFAHFNIVPPPQDCAADVEGTPMYPYFNAGVCVFSQDIFSRLRTSWIHWNRQLLEISGKLNFPAFHTDQASLTLALADTGIPVTQLSSAMNLPAHFALERYPARFADIDPVIIHYHGLAKKGVVGPLSLPLAQARAELFNARMREEGLL